MHLSHRCTSVCKAVAWKNDRGFSESSRCFDARIKATHKMIILGIELFYKLQNNRNVRVVTSNVLFPQISDFEIGNQLIFCGTPPYQELPNIIQE